MKLLCILSLIFLAGCSTRHITDSESAWIVQSRMGYDNLYWCTVRKVGGSERNGPVCYSPEIFTKNGRYLTPEEVKSIGKP